MPPIDQMRAVRADKTKWSEKLLIFAQNFRHQDRLMVIEKNISIVAVCFEPDDLIGFKKMNASFVGKARVIKGCGL